MFPLYITQIKRRARPPPRPSLQAHRQLPRRNQQRVPRGAAESLGSRSQQRRRVLGQLLPKLRGPSRHFPWDLGADHSRKHASAPPRQSLPGQRPHEGQA